MSYVKQHLSSCMRNMYPSVDNKLQALVLVCVSVCAIKADSLKSYSHQSVGKVRLCISFYNWDHMRE